MAVRERWFADGWELTDGFASDIDVLDGMLNTPAARGQATYAGGRHGALPGLRTRFDQGSLVLSMWLLATDAAAVRAAWHTFLRAAHQVPRLTHWQVTTPDGRAIEAWGRIGQSVQPTALGIQGYHASVELVIPAAFWQDQAVTTDRTPAGGASVLPVQLPLTSKAGASAPMQDLVFSITGPISNPVVTVRSDPMFTDWFFFAGVVAAGQTLVVDVGAETVSGVPGVTLDKLSWSGDVVLEVPPAVPGQVPTVELAGSGAGAGTALAVAGRAKYLTP